MKFKVGDTVKIVLDYSPNKGKIAKITNIYGKNPVLYDLEGFDSSYSEKSLLKVEYEVGDTIKIIRKTSLHFGEIYTIMEIKDYPFVEVSNNILFHINEIEKVQPKFKIGDKVIVTMPVTDYHGKICTITKVYPNCKYDLDIIPTQIDEGWLDLYEEPKFKIGDKVKVNNPGSLNHDKVGTIIRIYSGCIYGISGITASISECFLELYEEPKFKIGDAVKYKNGKVIYEITHFYTNGTIQLLHTKSKKYYTCENTNLLEKLKFQKGDKVRVINGKYKNNISIITGAHVTDTLYYDVKDSPTGLTEDSLELISGETPFKLGDLVVYSNPVNVYEVIGFYKDGRVKIKDLQADGHYSEIPKNLHKLKFQKGDLVRVLKGGSIIGTITSASVDTDTSIIYHIQDIRMHEQSIELVPTEEKTPDFKAGDIVYVNPDKVTHKSSCYKLFTVIEDSNSYVQCVDNKNHSITAPSSILSKTKFKPEDTVIILDKCVVGVVEKVEFHEKELSYKVRYSNGIGMESLNIWTLETNLESAGPPPDIAIKLSSLEVVNSIAEASGTIDNYINLLKNEDNENQLQGKETGERERNDARGSRIYGRKPKSAVKIQCLSYKEISCRS